MKLENNVLTFDIETVRGKFDLKLEDIKAPGNIKDPVKIAAAKTKKLNEALLKMGLNSFTAKISSISWAFGDGKIYEETGTDEELLLLKFNESLRNQFKENSNRPFEFVGHNIKGFDIPFLFHRAIKYNLEFLKAMLPSGSRSSRISDTMEMISPTIWKPLISLSNACNYFGIKSPKGDLDGSKVQRYYDAGRFEEIGDYCREDVRAERELYKKLK